VISNEAGVEVAYLVVQPYLEVEPCRGVCGDMADSYLGEVPWQGMLGDKSYAAQTKAMDVTSREDLQKANRWEGNVRLIVGVAGSPSTTTQAEDPFHFTTRAGIDVSSASSPVRPIFASDRYFETALGSVVWLMFLTCAETNGALTAKSTAEKLSSGC
jgi:hypothetical protein